MVSSGPGEGDTTDLLQHKSQQAAPNARGGITKVSRHENMCAFTNQPAHSCTQSCIPSTTGPGEIPGVADDLVHALNKSI